MTTEQALIQHLLTQVDILQKLVILVCAHIGIPQEVTEKALGIKPKRDMNKQMRIHQG